MEPPQQSHSLQPDQQEDDPDQDSDQPPPQPSPQLLDNNALSLVAQPLASAVARVAASHPLPLPLDDLNDFNVDLSWAAPDIDSLFLHDTQYLQLGDDHPSTPSPTPPVLLATPATATITHQIPDSQQHPQPTTTPQHDPSPPPRRIRLSTVTQKPTRPRPNQPPPKQNPIPIAPRIVNDPKQLQHLKIESSPPTPRSTQAQSSPLNSTQPKSAPPVHSPDPSPTSIALETTLPQNTQKPPNPVPHFPMGVSHPTMNSVMPLMNMMYPVQHHQSVFQPPPPVLTPTEPTTSDSKPLHPPVSSNPMDTNTTRLSDPQPPTPASQHSSQHRSVAQQQLTSPPMQVIPQGVVPYDPNIVPYFQMAYAAAAAGYPPGLIPPIPPASTNVPSTMLNPFGPNRAQPGQHNNTQNISATPVDASAANHTAQQPSRPHSKPPGAPVLVQEGGTQVLVPQQKAARLERHPVLGRLQLKSSSKPQEVSTSSGMRFVSETQTPSGDSQQKGFRSSTPGEASVSRPGSTSLSSGEEGQRQQKKRLVWTPELHDRFVKAINAVGLSQAVPKTLVTIMNVEGLTTEHVKSHLQKYRNSLRKEAADEERDRSRGAGSSAGPHNIKLGTPGASGASVIRSVAIVTPPGSGANQNGRAGGAKVTNSVGPQRLPILSSRINAFEGQMQGVIEPTLDTKESTQITKAMSAPQGGEVILENTQSKGQTRSPRLGFMRSAKQGDDVADNESGTGVVAQPCLGTNTTLRPSDRDGMQVDTDGVGGDENVKDSGPCYVEGGRDTRGVASHGTDDAVDLSQKDGGDSQAGQDLRRDALKGSEKKGNAGAESQGKRNTELEVIKEETQQMQLQVQMMIYRTIALEKKLEELHSERLNVKASGTGDASRRSTVGDANGNGGEDGECKMKDEEIGSKKKAESEDETKENDIVREANGVREGGKECNEEKDEEEEGTKKRRCPSEDNHHSEVKALLSEEMGLQRRIEDRLAMIDTFGKRRRREGEEIVEKKQE